MKIMKPYLNTGWNLADSLLQKGTTLGGTVRHSNRDIPPACKDTKGQQRKDFVYYYSDSHQCLLSYWDKRKSPVLLLSSMHKSPFVPGNKPEIVSFYNITKAGVDNMDRMVRYYSCKRKWRRWPFEVFMNLMDIAGTNASTIFRQSNDKLEKAVFKSNRISTT